VGGEGSFQVEHELMRRVVYDDLPLSRRLDLHRRIAGAIEERRPHEVELLAHHFGTARIPDRAADYLERAAEHALVVHAYDTAALHLGRAVEALAEIGASAERQFAAAALLEEVLDVLGRRDEQEHALGTMERHAGTAAETDVHRRRAWWLANQDRFQEAEESARLALETAQREGDGGRTISALTTAGMIACFAGRASDGVRLLEEAAEVHGADQRQEADARNALGQNLVDLQRFGEAESQLLSASTLYEALGDARGQAEVLGMLGTLRMERGEPESAESAFERAIDIARRIGYRHGEAVCQMNLAILRVITNRLGEALEAFDGAAETYRAMGNRRGLALVQSNAAWMRYSRLGRSDEARIEIGEALVVYREIGDTRGEAQCIGMLGSIASSSQHHDEARSLYTDALGLAQAAQDLWLSAQILREFGVSELLAGFPDEALRYATDAEGICTDAGMEDLAIGVRALKGRALLALDRPEEALHETSKAYKMLRPGIELAHIVHYSHALALTASSDPLAAEVQLDRAHALLIASVEGLDAEDRDRVLNAPDNNAIIEGWSRSKPQTAIYRLASSGAPAGRPLKDADYVDVVWTIVTPDDLGEPDKVRRRQQQLVRLSEEALAQGGAPTIEDLALAVSASPATVRRDVRALRTAGHTLTTRGSRTTT
jgi:tetratricopeptide (TPR) repeat protein